MLTLVAPTLGLNENIGVNFCKAPRLEPPHFSKSKALRAFEPPPHFLSDAIYFFAYYEVDS